MTTHSLGWSDQEAKFLLWQSGEDQPIARFSEAEALDIAAAITRRVAQRLAASSDFGEAS